MCVCARARARVCECAHVSMSACNLKILFGFCCTIHPQISNSKVPCTTVSHQKRNEELLIKPTLIVYTYQCGVPHDIGTRVVSTVSQLLEVKKQGKRNFTYTASLTCMIINTETVARLSVFVNDPLDTQQNEHCSSSPKQVAPLPWKEEEGSWQVG